MTSFMEFMFDYFSTRGVHREIFEEGRLVHVGSYVQGDHHSTCLSVIGSILARFTGTIY